MEENDYSRFTVVLDKVINERSHMPVTRLLAVDMKQCPYMSVGEFFQNIPDDQLRELLEVAEDQEDPRFAELILIAEMLAQAEGVDDQEESDDIIDIVHHRVSQLVIFITLESLYRKKLIKLHRENMSFGEDMADKVIAEKVDDGSNNKSD